MAPGPGRSLSACAPGSGRPRRRRCPPAGRGLQGLGGGLRAARALSPLLWRRRAASARRGRAAARRAPGGRGVAFRPGSRSRGCLCGLGRRARRACPPAPSCLLLKAPARGGTRGRGGSRGRGSGWRSPSGPPSVPGAGGLCVGGRGLTAAEGRGSVAGTRLSAKY